MTQRAFAFGVLHLPGPTERVQGFEQRFLVAARGGECDRRARGQLRRHRSREPERRAWSAAPLSRRMASPVSPRARCAMAWSRSASAVRPSSSRMWSAIAIDCLEISLAKRRNGRARRFRHSRERVGGRHATRRWFLFFEWRERRAAATEARSTSGQTLGTARATSSWEVNRFRVASEPISPRSANASKASAVRSSPIARVAPAARRPNSRARSASPASTMCTAAEALERGRSRRENASAAALCHDWNSRSSSVASTASRCVAPGSATTSGFKRWTQPAATSTATVASVSSFTSARRPMTSDRSRDSAWPPRIASASRTRRPSSFWWESRFFAQYFGGRAPRFRKIESA